MISQCHVIFFVRLNDYVFFIVFTDLPSMCCLVIKQMKQIYIYMCVHVFAMQEID